MSVISFLTKCRRSPGGCQVQPIWSSATVLGGGLPELQRLTVFCGLALRMVTLVLENLWKVPGIVNLTGHLTLAAARPDQSTVSVVNLVHPPRRITSLAPVGTSLWISISHGHTRLCRAPGHPATPGPSVTWGKITAGTL
ncbi:hypothetical protein CHARACLAT_030759 [Characodon lateralis]|uniref:Uncharacterized protein n=1 Tax=Characodon lateralis TaxID=208331 RepID=A0ABU7EEG5_9TELE|nr:hypothetical protein [Characodon lateralis]